MQRKYISLILVLISLTLITGCDKKDTTIDTPKEEEITSNTNENIVKDQNVEGLTLTNTSLVTKEGQSTLVTLVTNSSTATVTVKSFNIILKDKDENILVTLLGYVGGEIPAGESRTITSTVEMDLTNANSISYTINK